MSHATHFLHRIERLSATQADIALALYRDPGLVQFVLGHARLPEGAERVALALEDRPDSPHLIVTRDGRFVTCLGAGMSTGSTPRLSRGQLDRLAETIESYRTAIERSYERNESKRLFRALFRAGNALTREQFQDLALLVPLIGPELIEAMAKQFLYVHEQRQGYHRRQYSRLNQRVTDELRLYWEAIWFLGHGAALFGQSGRDLAEIHGVADRDEPIELARLQSWMAAQTMYMPILMRGAFLAARTGRKLIPYFKRTLAEYSDFRGFLAMHLQSVLLMAIAMRHSGARGEVRKLIERFKMPGPTSRWHETMLGAFQTMAPEVLDKTEGALVLYAERGWELVLKRWAELPEGHPMRYPNTEGLTDELVVAFPMCLDEPLHLDHQRFITSLTVVAFAAQVPDGSSLYLPAALSQAFCPPWRPEAVLQEMAAFNAMISRDGPARREGKPGRNEPCSCGSGKKYKRCCGA